MSPRLDIPLQPSDEHREAVLRPLADFNARNGFPSDTKPLAIVLRGDADEPIGGLWGRTGYAWLFVEFLVVPEDLQGDGLGASLLAGAEEIARQRGCVGAWLTTFTFQAQGFYEKLGYSVFGELEDSPAPIGRIFLRKRF